MGQVLSGVESVRLTVTDRKRGERAGSTCGGHIQPGARPWARTALLVVTKKKQSQVMLRLQQQMIVSKAITCINSWELY